MVEAGAWYVRFLFTLLGVTRGISIRNSDIFPRTGDSQMVEAEARVVEDGGSSPEGYVHFFVYFTLL